MRFGGSKHSTGTRLPLRPAEQPTWWGLSLGIEQQRASTACARCAVCAGQPIEPPTLCWHCYGCCTLQQQSQTGVRCAYSAAAAALPLLMQLLLLLLASLQCVRFRTLLRALVVDPCVPPQSLTTLACEQSQ